MVNVGSPVGPLGARKVSYAASKAGLIGLSHSLARGFADDGVRVNLLLPGPTLTGMTEDWSAKKSAAVGAGTLLGRLCAAEEIAGGVAFLLGPDSTCMTGAVLDMTGGQMIGGRK